MKKRAMTLRAFVIISLIVVLIVMYLGPISRVLTRRNAEVVAKVRTEGVLRALTVVSQHVRVRGNVETEQLWELLELERNADSLVLENVDKQNGTVLDAWGRPIRLKTDDGMPTNVTLLSAGKNGQFEGGRGDDVVIVDRILDR